MSAPIPFDGTPEQARANFNTHYWVNHFGEHLCGECDSKPWHAAAHYPCGASVPRTDDESTHDASALRFAVYAAVLEIVEEP